MSLTLEWRARLDAWLTELKSHFYLPLGSVNLEGFTTREHLIQQEAAKRKFLPMPVGTEWGAKWEYGWFRCAVALPAPNKVEWAGKRIVFRSGSGGEMLVYVNGREAGSIADGGLGGIRPEVTLASGPRAGERFQILMEAYAGHGATPWSIGPLPPGRVSVPEPPPTQQTVRESTFGIWDDGAHQLWLDATMLFSLRESLDPDSLRVAEIDAGLRDFTTIADFELPADEMRATFRAARRRLAPLLARRNGPTAPVFFGFGHGHIDVAWLWPLAETARKAARTFSNQLALIREYPGYKFLHSQPHLYWMVQQHYPELYERLKEAVKAGRIIAEGSMWVEPDMNISGGESLIRQCLHGKRFFREQFGVECRLLWLPDVFGYSAALPQILKGCGIRYFATAKIFWNYYGGEPFPYNTFTWEGIDGSTVLAHLFKSYSSWTDARTLARYWNERAQKDGISTLLLSYGWGDGGGGPGRDHVEYARRAEDLEGCPKVKPAGPVEFFKDVERGLARRKLKSPPERYVGELYFQAHRGTYTSQARTKRGNRKSEAALREAEMWSAAAQALAGFAFPRRVINDLWRATLLNQFHDILPGSSIGRVYQEAEAAYAGVLREADKVTRSAARALTRGDRACTVFNSLSWERAALAPLPKGWKAAADSSGATLPVQRLGATTYAEVKVPACGWTTIRPHSKPAPRGPSLQGRPDAPSGPGAYLLENGVLRLRFNDRGEITSIFDKEARRELAAGLCNSFRMYKDVPSKFDAWDIDSSYSLMPVKLDAPAKIRAVAGGPLVGQLRIERSLNRSAVTQFVRLRAGSRRVDFETRVAWRESHKLLKVAFPVGIHATEAVHEIQFGHLRRPNHYSREGDADKFEVSNQKWSALVEEGRGFAVLNDCKYGLNVLGNSINLTLLRSSKAPDMRADQGLQEFTYSFYAWNGSLAESEVVREAYDLNYPVFATPGDGGVRSLFQVDAPAVIVECVKPAEDGSEDVIVRLYECKRTAVRCALETSLPLKSALATDLLENNLHALPVRAGRIELEFRPFEIKTVRLRLGK